MFLKGIHPVRCYAFRLDMQNVAQITAQVLPVSRAGAFGIRRFGIISEIAVQQTAIESPVDSRSIPVAINLNQQFQKVVFFMTSGVAAP